VRSSLSKVLPSIGSRQLQDQRRSLTSSKPAAAALFWVMRSATWVFIIHGYLSQTAAARACHMGADMEVPLHEAKPVEPMEGGSVESTSTQDRDGPMSRSLKNWLALGGIVAATARTFLQILGIDRSQSLPEKVRCSSRRFQRTPPGVSSRQHRIVNASYCWRSDCSAQAHVDDLHRGIISRVFMARRYHNHHPSCRIEALMARIFAFQASSDA